MTELKIKRFLHGGDYNPEQWLGTPEVINQDFALFKNADINTITVGIFSWSKLEPSEGKYDFKWLDDIFDRIEKMNGYVILATPSGARPAWLAQKYPEVLRTNEKGIKRGFGGRHNHCLTSPIYRNKVREINTKLAEHFGRRKSLILWHVSNEYSGDCYCELCRSAFRKWLKKKYKTLDSLNHAWWNTFWSHTFDDWEQINPPSSMSEKGSRGLNLDWHRFVTDQTISFIDNEIAPLKKFTPNIPVTTNMMAGSPLMEPFVGLDYQKIAKHLDVISWDSYPAWSNDYQSTEEVGRNVGIIHDFFRSLNHKNFLVMENTPSRVNWQSFNRAKRPEMHELASLQDIAHGSNSVLYFQLRASRGGAEMFHGAVLEHLNPSKTRVYQDVKKVGKDLLSINSLINSNYVKSKVAIVYSYDNFWALNDAESYMKDKKIWQTIQEHYRYFYENDIPVDFVSPMDDFSSYDLLIDPMHFMMSIRYINKLYDFVKNGGKVVGTYISGVVDENYLAYMNEWPKKLQKIYGIEPVENDVLYPTQYNIIDTFFGKYKSRELCEVIVNHSAKILGTYCKDFYRNTPAITKNKLGKGFGYYIGCRTNYDFLKNFYAQIIKDSDKEDLIEKSSTKISIQRREDEEYRYYFVQNFSHEQHVISLNNNFYEMLNKNYESGIIKIHGYGSKIYRIAK